MILHWDIEVLEDLPSTQDVCRARARDGGQQGLVIQALNQSAGKGRHGREWVSSEGNLTFSFILRPDCDVKLIGQISVMVGVALAKTVGNGAWLKWPNDVLIDEGKCAGILIDSDLSGQNVNWLVVGVGVNTLSAPEIGAALSAERDGFRDRLLENIAVYYARWRDSGFADIRVEWIEASYPKGTMLNVGVFEDLDEFGNLIVLDEQNQRETISAGDVYLKDTHYAAGD